LINYIDMVARLVAEGMTEEKAIGLVANSYGLDYHILSIAYKHHHAH